MTLPLASSPAPHDTATATATNGVTQTQRILVVDDNADARHMLQIALQHAGHEVATAGDGKAAIATAAQFIRRSGCSISGCRGMSGYELARHLRSSHPGIRLIALTGYGQAWDLEAAAAAGFDAHLAQPIMTTALLDRIEGIETSDV